LFDLGIGRAYVVRVAGNVAGELELASIDLAVALGTPLVVVLGHTDCKAVAGALDGRQGPIFDRIREHASAEDPIAHNALGNARLVRAALGGPRVLAAVYDVETGRVSFFD
jgi:carbonic anhydrase